MNRLVMDPTQIRQPVARGALGLNVNFLADHAEMRQRGQGYLAALKQIGVRSLRYPGGEISNEVFWSQPLWRESRPTLSLTGSAARLFKESKLVSETGEFHVKPMDFDEFMGLCHAVNAEPILCVGLGSAYIQNQPGRVGSTRQQVIENAVEWVRYANQVRGYGIKYWELGNESYWRGSIATLTAAEYTRDVLELSRAMKAIDPAIHIGVNGHVDMHYVSSAETGDTPIWWEYLLKHAAPAIDFVVVHPYPCFEWGSYDYYPQHVPVFIDAVEQADAALQAWAPEHAARIRIMATETNAFDWAATHWYQGNLGGWQWGNDLGHALVLFDLIGQHLAHPRVDGVHVWNTRWFDSPSRLEDVLDDQNALLPTGKALGLWGRSLKSKLLALPTEAGAAYVTYEPSTQALTACQRDPNDPIDLGQGYVSFVDGLLTACCPSYHIRVLNRGIPGDTVRELQARWASTGIWGISPLTWQPKPPLWPETTFSKPKPTTLTPSSAAAIRSAPKACWIRTGSSAQA